MSLVTSAMTFGQRKISANPNTNVTSAWSRPKSNQFLLATRETLQKYSSKFVNNFLSYPANRQIDSQTPYKIYPLGEGKNVSIYCSTMSIFNPAALR